MAALTRRVCLYSNAVTIPRVLYVPWCRRLFRNMTMEVDDSMRQGGMALKEHFDSHRRQRQKRKLTEYRSRLGMNLPTSEIQFHIVGTGSHGSAKAVLLSTPHTSYLFNCGDGVARQCLETCPRLWTKVDHIFITYKSWQRLGGTFDLCACIENAKGNDSSPLYLHGLGYVDCILDGGKRTFGSDLGKIVKKFPDNESYSDHVMSVEQIRIADPNHPDVDDKAACAYKLVFRPPKRKCDTSKLVQLCIKAGPWISDLIDKNEPVVVDGKTVHPDDVLFLAEPSVTCLVIDCPTVNHLTSLANQSKVLYSVEDTQAIIQFVDVVVHLTPHEVFQHPAYQKWLTGFPKSTEQLFVSETDPGICFTSAWRQQVHLNLINNEVFPLLCPRPESAESTQSAQSHETVTVLSAGSTYVLRPKQSKGVNINQVPVTKESAYEEFNEKDLVFKELVNRKSYTNLTDTREYPVISFLGTGSSTSTKTRNVTGILVQTSSSNYVLMDCGTGSYGQLVRLHGPKCDDILSKLSLIFISHGHADHHMGLLSFIEARYHISLKMNLPKLYIMAPRKMGIWFDHLSREFPNYMDNIHFLPSNYLLPHNKGTHSQAAGSHGCFVDPPNISSTDRKRFPHQFGLKTLEPFLVKHAYGLNCFGLVLSSDDWKLVFSGDTMPCTEVIEAAKDADVLIHEATFDDTFESDAKLKTHSTTGQVLDVAEASRAKFTILTHFSSRYTRIPDPSERLIKAANVGIAFDNMVVRPKDLPNLTMASLYDVLNVMYPDSISEIEKKSFKKKIKTLKNSGVPADEIVKKLNIETVKFDGFKQKLKNQSPESNPTSSTSQT